MIIFQDLFVGKDGLITSEYDYWNGIKNKDWEMTSGSLFRKGNRGYTGVPVSGVPNKDGVPNHSNDFRLNTVRKDFEDYKVSFLLNIKGLTETKETPKVDWDGLHVFINYNSQYELYYASVSRRDGKILFKKKVKGGISNGGTYYTISKEVLKPFPLNKDVRVRIEVLNVKGGVNMKMYISGVLVNETTDYGANGRLYTEGAVGIRADNCEFTFDDFTVESL